MPHKDAFADSRAGFEQIVGFLDGEARSLTHAELEDELGDRGRLLLRQMYQDHLHLRTLRERRTPVQAADGTRPTWVRADRERQVSTVFGNVTHARLSYRQPGRQSLHPADAELNLPAERYSHGIRKMAVQHAIRGSFDDATTEIRTRTGTKIAKRQVEALTCRAAVDVEGFYASRPHTPVDADDVLVLSADGKGIVMRPEALRPATAAKAAASTNKLSTRLSKGEKQNRKRMAEVGAVYDAAPSARSPHDVIATSDTHERAPAPRATNKWLTASVVDDAAEVITRIFDEAKRRDPDHQRTWVALVDGNTHQITRIEAEAEDRHVNVTILLDFIHVLEYLWKAAWCFYNEGDPAAETWVKTRALAVLNGHPTAVAATIRRTATRHNLTPAQRTGADRCATYLCNKRNYLDYPTALQQGWPIATGIIEGACRHLVKDRMDITGARWGLDGAEAVLKLRALNSNGDLNDYWHHHLRQEHHRTHATRYITNQQTRTAA